MLNNVANKTAKFHLVVKQTIERDNAKHIFPVLYFDHADGTVSRLDILVQHFLDYSYRSYDWMNTRAQVLGYLWDYVRSQSLEFDWSSEYSHRILFRHFGQALLNGTINFESLTDHLELYWGPTPKNKVNDWLHGLTDFTLWCHDEGYRSNLAISSNDQITPETYLSFIYVARHLKSVNFLSHLVDENKLATKLHLQHRASPIHFEPEKPLAGYFDPVKAFPKTHIEPFLKHGFEVNPLADKLHERYDLTGKMIATLLFYGGLRRSEPLHIWFNDVTPGSNECKVLIPHPQYAQARIGKEPSMKREEYLRIVGLGSRNLANDSKSYFAGWKDLLTGPDHIANLFWINKEAESTFGEMFIYYLSYRQSLIEIWRSNGNKNHPFLFVSNGKNSEDYRGAPYSIPALQKSWGRALTRLSTYLGEELKPSKDEGLTPHGPRHFYGSWLAEANVDPKIIQICMHHKSPESQKVYTNVSLLHVHRTLSGLINDTDNPS